MIENWNRHNLYMDFKNIKVLKGHPSDIDMFYLGENYVIYAEIKNHLGTFTQEQKDLYEKLADSNKLFTYVLFLTHDKFVENGDKFVDVAECQVREYYYNGEWHKPKKPLSCQEALNIIQERHF